jgi:hypothetical protein
VVEDLLDDRRVGDEGDDPHLATAFGTDERIDLVHPPDHLRPTPPPFPLVRRQILGLLGSRLE